MTDSINVVERQDGHTINVVERQDGHTAVSVVERQDVRMEWIPKKKVLYVGRHFVMISAGPRFNMVHFFTLKKPFLFTALKAKHYMSSDINEIILGYIHNDDRQNLYEFLLELDRLFNNDVLLDQITVADCVF